MIVAGTNQDIVFWDVRKIKHPLDVLESSHCDDITAVDFHPMSGQHQRVLTCSIDCQVNYFDFAGKDSMAEEEGALEATYCSDCALIGCGFVGRDDRLFWALTSVNTLELCNLETADLFTKVVKFPHAVTNIVSVQRTMNSLYLHCSDNKGKLVSYEIDIAAK